MDDSKVSKDEVATCLGKQLQREIVSGKNNIYKCQFCRKALQSFDLEKIWWMWLRRIGSGHWDCGETVNDLVQHGQASFCQ